MKIPSKLNLRSNTAYTKYHNLNIATKKLFSKKLKQLPVKID